MYYDARGTLIYLGVYGVMYGGILATGLIGRKVRECKLKRKLKKEEVVDLSKKAEANGWQIVECEYTIEAN